MEQYAVVYFPKIDVEKVQSIREKYDPMFGVIPPHITLVFPFADVAEEKVVEHLATVTKNIASFPIYFSGFMKSFDDYLFLLVQEGKEEIQKVHDVLYSGILAPQLKNDIPFIPHITLGEFANNNELYEKALAEAESLQIDIHTTFDTLTLIKGDGVNPATTVTAFGLQ